MDPILLHKETVTHIAYMLTSSFDILLTYSRICSVSKNWRNSFLGSRIFSEEIAKRAGISRLPFSDAENDHLSWMMMIEDIFF